MERTSGEKLTEPSFCEQNSKNIKKNKLPSKINQKPKKKAVMHYLIKDTEFEIILKIVNRTKGIHKNNVVELRNFIEAVYYIGRSDCQ